MQVAGCFENNRNTTQYQTISHFIPVKCACINKVFTKMVRGKPMSEDLRKSIVSAHVDGVSGRQIAKNLKISRSTVRNIISLFKREGNIKTKVKCGRTSKISKRDYRVLQRLIKQDRRISSRELAVKWGDTIGRQISKDTCLRHVKKLGYNFYKVSFTNTIPVALYLVFAL